MPTTTRRRVLFWGLTIVIIAGALAIAFRPRPLPVDLAAVTRGPLQVTSLQEGL
jgi:uncharacterized membrane protein